MAFLQETSLTGDAIRQRYAQEFSAIQGYTIVNHGRNYIWLGLLSLPALDPNERAGVKSLLSDFASRLTSAYELYQSFEDYLSRKQTTRDDESGSRQALREELHPAIVRGLGLSSHGYNILDISDGDRPLGEAFTQGLKQRFSSVIPSFDGTNQRFAALFVLAGNKNADIEVEAGQLRDQFSRFGTIVWEPGSLLKKDGILRDHFNFREGISQPIFFSKDMPASAGVARLWDPSAALSYVLSPQPGAPDGEYGSFMAFLKIAQNKKAFDEVVHGMSIATGKAEAEVRSWILGRKDDGEPLVAYEADYNNFNYSGDAEGCPSAAHIRKVNPRSDTARNHRILRRSAFYDQDDSATDCGILFQCFQAKLETGFEFIFKEWALNKNQPEQKSGLDPILGSRDAPPRPASVPIRPQAHIPLTVRSFTEIKYGEYFHFPSVPFLRSRIR